MKHKLTFDALLLSALFLTAAPAALASTTWYVSGASGSDSNNCMSPTTACKTIGQAIALAHSGDSITVAAATYTENLTIGISLNVLGAGAATTIIDGGGRFGPNVVNISNTSAHVTLSRMTIRNGNAELTGGGVYNSGTLTINNSTVSGNVATGYCNNRFGCFFSLGGGIYSLGTLTINNSTVSGNVATGLCPRPPLLCAGGLGGGIASNSGTLTINNSTVSGNSSIRGGGGGIYHESGLLAISNSTISGNSGYGAGGIYNYAGHATLQNSIVANNTSAGEPGNCSGAMTSKGYNLSSDNTCNFTYATHDLPNTDPLLGPLQYNRGPNHTQTIALLPGSPAIDAGNPSGCRDSKGNLLKTDQRGYPRPNMEDTSGCDIGAFERQSD